MAYKTGTTLVIEAGTYTEGDTIDSVNAKIWINEFLTHKLGVKAKIKATQDYINSEAQVWYNLPPNFEELYKVEEFLSPGMADIDFYRNYFYFEVSDDRIKFLDSGHYRLHYFILPSEISILSDSVQVDPVFYLPLTLWLAYRHLTNDDEDQVLPNSLGAQRLAEFNIALANAIAYRAKRFKVKRKIQLSRRCIDG